MATVPGLGKIPLLASPSLDEAANILNGSGIDAQGYASLSVGAALEVPWANRMGGVATPDGDRILAVWQGQTIDLPVTPQTAAGAPSAVGGLMLKRQANTVEQQSVGDGRQSKVVYDTGGFLDGHRLSTTEVSTQVLLNSRAMDITVTAKNTGSVAEPIGIGWRPRFALPGGRDNTVLRLPDSQKHRDSGPGLRQFAAASPQAASCRSTDST